MQDGQHGPGWTCPKLLCLRESLSRHPKSVAFDPCFPRKCSAPVADAQSFGLPGTTVVGAAVMDDMEDIDLQSYLTRNDTESLWFDHQQGP